MPTRLEYKDSKSHKFWEISVKGKQHTVSYGRMGTAGQSKTKAFASPVAAKADAEKLIKSKRRKGYELASAKSAKSPKSARTSQKPSSKQGKASSKPTRPSRAKTIAAATKKKSLAGKPSTRKTATGVVDVLDADKKAHIGKSTEDGLTLLWRVSGRYARVALVEKDFAVYKRLDDLQILDLETGKKRAELKKKFLRADLRDSQLWVITARGYDIIGLPKLNKVKVLDFPAARTEEQGSLIDASDRAFYKNTVYRTAEDRKLRFSSKSKHFVQSVDLRSTKEAFLVQLPIGGYVEEMEASADVIWVAVWPSQSVRYLVVLDRKTGAAIHQQKVSVESFVRWKSDVLVNMKSIWHRWDKKKGKPVPCKGIPSGATLEVLGNQLYAHSKGGLLRLKADGREFKADLKQTRAKKTKALFKYKQRLGCLAPKNGVGGAHTLLWLNAKDLSVIGQASLKLKPPFEASAKVFGNHLVISGDGAMCFRLP